MNRDLRWAPFRSLFKKEVRRFLRVIHQTVSVPLINSSLYLLIFGVSLGRHIQVNQGTSYLSFLIPGLIMMGVLNNAFQNSSSSIMISKFHGDLEDLKISPLVPIQIVLAMGLAGLIRGIIVGVVIFLSGQVFSFFHTGALLGVARPLALVAFLVLGGLSFALLGVIVGFTAKTVDQMTMIGEFVLLPLVFLGGVFFPLDSLHPFWVAFSKLNPMLYFINGVRYGMLGKSDVAWPVALTFCSATLLVFFTLAYQQVKKGSFSRW